MVGLLDLVGLGEFRNDLFGGQSRPVQIGGQTVDLGLTPAQRQRSLMTALASASAALSPRTSVGGPIPNPPSLGQGAFAFQQALTNQGRLARGQNLQQAQAVSGLQTADLQRQQIQAQIEAQVRRQAQIEAMRRQIQGDTTTGEDEFAGAGSPGTPGLLNQIQDPQQRAIIAGLAAGPQPAAALQQGANFLTQQRAQENQRQLAIAQRQAADRRAALGRRATRENIFIRAQTQAAAQRAEEQRARAQNIQATAPLVSTAGAAPSVPGEEFAGAGGPGQQITPGLIRQAFGGARDPSIRAQAAALEQAAASGDLNASQANERFSKLADDERNTRKVKLTEFLKPDGTRDQRFVNQFGDVGEKVAGGLKTVLQVGDVGKTPGGQQVRLEQNEQVYASILADVSSLRQNIEKNRGDFGSTGFFRNAAQEVAGMMNDMADAFARQVGADENLVPKEIRDRVFDTNVAVARSNERKLALMIAAIRKKNPNERILKQEFELALDEAKIIGGLTVDKVIAKMRLLEKEARNRFNDARKIRQRSAQGLVRTGEGSPSARAPTVTVDDLRAIAGQ